MVRTRLRYHRLAEIVGTDGLAILTLTDENDRRALNVVCDQSMRHQLQMRAEQHDLCNLLLPEVMLMMLNDYVDVKKLELTIFGIHEGQYLVSLLNQDNYSIHQIRLSDAVLLHVMANVPLYIDEKLMESQSIPFDSEQTRISIPINTIDTEKLKAELDKAVEDEDYRLASYIKEELSKRKPKDENAEQA